MAYSVGDRVYAGDLWVVIELESNGRGLRTALGKAVAAHICSAIKASQAVGWTPLVVGGKSICCRYHLNKFSTCLNFILLPIDFVHQLD